MAWVKYNANPQHKRVGDCTVRAISKALGQSWKKTYTELMLEGLLLCDMPSANHVWGSYLRNKGFKRKIIPDNYPVDYTVEDFANDHPNGTYVLALSSHVVPVIDGSFFDTWDSSHEIVIFYFERK